jgi:hypothetical protein
MVFIACATCFFFYAAHFVAASQSSALQSEANALLASGWWSWRGTNYTNNTSSRCEWLGITCNVTGGVIDIVMGSSGFYLAKMSKLNLSCFSNLVRLDLFETGLQGSIPVEIGTLSKLRYLDLSYNTLTGPIPSTLGNLTNLKYLSLDSNQITGSIPSTLGNLTHLKRLYLRSNQIIGPIPSTLGNLTNLEYLYLHSNQINGSIPPELGNLHSLENLNLSHNFISGEALAELGFIDNFWSLDISHNNLTGNILNSYISIQTIILSYNSLTGPIPTYFHRYDRLDIFFGNKNLCGDFTGYLPCLPTRNKSNVTKAKICVPIAIFLGFLVLGGFFLCRRMVKKPQFESRKETKNGNLFSIWNYDGHIAYEDIIEATEDFDIKYCIGTGGYGNVYKAKLPCGKVIALKKLHRLEAENPTFDMSFRNEVKVLTEIRHRNIIKLHGFCLHKRCMFLVYEYMERGSLFCILNNDVEAIELDWSKRLNIIKGTAHALSYMHHECIPAIVHRDITSNNILLNNKLEAFLSDFGTAKLLDPDSSNQTLVAGTYGYIAPGKQFFSLQ